MVSHKFVILFAIVAAIQLVRARITVTANMNPRELESLGSILVETYLRHNLIQCLPTARGAILAFILKIPRAVYDFLNLTSSLICAGILTPILHEKYVKSEQKVVQSEPKPIVVQEYSHPKNVMHKKCDQDFGCDRNICWRSCHSDAKKSGWCYSSPNVKHHKYQQCIYAHDCSPCWECIGPCNA